MKRKISILLLYTKPLVNVYTVLRSCLPKTYQKDLRSVTSNTLISNGNSDLALMGQRIYVKYKQILSHVPPIKHTQLSQVIFFFLGFYKFLFFKI